LIPRPETEELVMAATNFMHQEDLSVLDIGTGSGCIAIAVKKNKGKAQVTAIDISKAALSIARANAMHQQTEIEFLETNFLIENNWKQLHSYDVIISNPPYIPENEKKLLDKNVAEYEPHDALFVAVAEPLIFYKKISAFGKTHLNKSGKIFMETHMDFAGQVAVYFRQEGYNAEILKDMFGKDRIVVADL
jgi:release factor glutamine methyltransferase